MRRGCVANGVVRTRICWALKRGWCPPRPWPRTPPQIMSYYILTVVEQDDGLEVQRLVKELVRNKVSDRRSPAPSREGL